VTDIRAGFEDHESHAASCEVVADGQPRLAPAHDDDVERAGRRTHLAAELSRETSKLNIMPLCACSAM
jgi:hypothetical protein